jgi:hypothetical protein
MELTYLFWRGRGRERRKRGLSILLPLLLSPTTLINNEQQKVGER